jgi:hypothetical protein
MAAYQVCSNKSPWFKIGIGPGAYIQVSNFSRAIMALLFVIAFRLAFVPHPSGRKLLVSTTSPHKLLSQFHLILTGMFLCWSPLKKNSNI